MNSNWLRAINISNFNFEKMILIYSEVDMNIENKILARQILSPNSYAMNQLNFYCKVIVSIDSYNVIYNTALFIRMIPILFSIECKNITNIRVARPILKYKQIVR